MGPDNWAMPRGRPRVGGEIIKVRIPGELREQIDVARGPRSRSQWGREAFYAALDGGSPSEVREGGRKAARHRQGVQVAGSEPQRGESPRVLCQCRGIAKGAWCKTCQAIKR